MDGTAPWLCPYLCTFPGYERGGSWHSEGAEPWFSFSMALVFSCAAWFSLVIVDSKLCWWSRVWDGILPVTSTTTLNWLYKRRMTEVEAHHRRFLQQWRTFPCRKFTFLFLGRLVVINGKMSLTCTKFWEAKGMSVDLISHLLYQLTYNQKILFALKCYIFSKINVLKY